jgi:carboxyl-terminal processing protease
MGIHNKKSVVLYPIILAIVLVIGIYTGIKLGNSKTSEQLLIFPRVDKVNSVLNLIEDSYVDSVSRDKLEKVAIEAILQKLDPHSVYIPSEIAQATNEILEGNFTGIGVQYNLQSDTVVVINTVLNGPSERAGVRGGDRIIKVNDTIVAGVNITNDKIVKKLKGVKGTRVKLTVRRNGFKEAIDFDIIRDIVALRSIDASYMINKETGYLKISKFSKNTYEEFISAVKDLHRKGMKKIIIDLRGNGGGYLETVIKIADEFLDDHQLIVFQKGRACHQINSFSAPGGICIKDSVAILIDEYSASASEILAGAIQDNDRGWIVGRRSFGKGLVQEQSMLPGGAMIRLTIARYYTPTGRCIQKPYKDGLDNYNDDIHKRFLHGEMAKADSIKFSDSLKFITPKGRVVYGGGGIMPDFFVPVDTVSISDYYYQVREKGLIYRFGFMYSDSHRNELSKIKTYQQLVRFLKKQKVLDKFITYSLKSGIHSNIYESKESQRIIQTELESYIVRNFFDTDGFYPIYNTLDKTVLKSLEVLHSK